MFRDDDASDYSFPTFLRVVQVWDRWRRTSPGSASTTTTSKPKVKKCHSFHFNFSFFFSIFDFLKFRPVGKNVWPLPINNSICCVPPHFYFYKILNVDLIIFRTGPGQQHSDSSFWSNLEKMFPTFWLVASLEWIPPPQPQPKFDGNGPIFSLNRDARISDFHELSVQLTECSVSYHIIKKDKTLLPPKQNFGEIQFWDFQISRRNQKIKEEVY